MSVKFRITLVTALFLACTSLALSFFTLRTQRDCLHIESVRKVNLTLSMLSDMATRPLLQGDLMTLARIADRAAAGQPEQVMIADRNGKVIADSAHTSYDSSVAATKVVKQNGRGSVVRKGSIWEGTAPVRDDLGRMTGVVYVTFPTHQMDAALAEITRMVLAFAFMSVLLGTLIAYGLGRYLSASLVPLLSAIRKTAHGKFESKISRTGMIELDEIGREAEFKPGCEVAEGICLHSGIVAPLITPDRETAGILIVELNARQSPSPGCQDVAAVLAVANLAAPILAVLTMSLTQEKMLEALREILLPEAVTQPEGLEVYACFEPAEASSGFGGDYYDVMPLGEHLWGFAIGDVTGHGLDAGRYTAMAKYVVRSYAQEYRSPAQTILQADKALSAQMDDNTFVTIFVGMLDTEESALTYCCAGHPPGLLYSLTSDNIRRLRTGGGLVGYGLSSEYSEGVIALQTYDLLVLCTDGILEAMRSDKEYGIERLESVVRENARRSLKNIASAVMDDVRNFAQNMVRDDMALLMIRVLEQPRLTPPRD